MNSNFAHLHVHTQYSLLDGALRLEGLFEAAVADKMEALAITDHGNMFGVLDFYFKAKEAGIKPILGCEVYLAPQSRHMKSTHQSLDDEQAPYETCRSGVHHLILLCENEVGYRNLCQIVSLGYLEGFYYKPRVDKELLQKYQEGLIATSACLKGEINHLCLIGDMDRARKAALWYQEVFKGRFYLEMQHNGLPQQVLINQRLQELSEELQIPLVATADCHYLTKEDAPSQEVLMAIQTGKHFDNPNLIQPKSDEFYFKSQALMAQEFSFCPQALTSTMEIAERCSFEFKLTDKQGRQIYHLPKFEPPNQVSLETYLREESQRGLERRLTELAAFRKRPFTEIEMKDYQQRLETELKVIIEMGFEGYFLIVADFIQFAKTHGIPVGPGRGSGAGSVVAYSLRITDLDPLEHGLLFERFLNPERVSMPDFDIDFCMEKRDEVIRYVTEKYGIDCVAQIITFGKLQARGVIRDVGRVFGMPVPEVDKIAKLVPNTLNITLQEALEQEPRLRQLQEKDRRVSQLLRLSQSLEGLYRHASIHAAGLVISNVPMVQHCPLYRGKEGELVIQFDMVAAEKIGLIKFDFLGLKTLTFLRHAEQLIRQRHPESDFNLELIDLRDPAMYAMLSKGDTLGIFQLESSGMQDLLRRIRPDCFADITAINALYRPGPMGSGMLEDFSARKHGEVAIQYDFPQLEPILKETYGVIVYQEQVQQIAVQLANYTLGGADLLRRAMGKKKPEVMAKQKVTFLEGAIKNGHPREKAEKLFDLMEKFAGYGFNKSHAAAYALIACQTAFLKAHYQVEFYASLLTTERENTDKITRYISDAKAHGIDVLPPSINESVIDFTVLSEKQIRFGLGAVKGVGEIAIEEILTARKNGGPFSDLYDVCSRTPNRTVNKRVLEALIKAGALDGLGPHRAALFEATDSALERGSAIQKSRDALQSSFADILGEQDPSFQSRQASYPDTTPWPRLLELNYEKETIGFFVSGHPLDAFRYELNQFTSANIRQCLGETRAKDCFLGATVAALREIITKRGDRMAFATLEDGSDQIEAVIFSDAYLENEALLKGTDPLWIRGRIEPGETGNKMILSKKNNAKILALQYAYEELAREIHVYLQTRDDSIPQSQLEQLQNFLRTRSVSTGASLYLHLNLEGRTRPVLKLKNAFPLERGFIGDLKSCLGAERTRIEFF